MKTLQEELKKVNTNKKQIRDENKNSIDTIDDLKNNKGFQKYYSKLDSNTQKRYDASLKLLFPDSQINGVIKPNSKSWDIKNIKKILSERAQKNRENNYNNNLEAFNINPKKDKRLKGYNIAKTRIEKDAELNTPEARAARVSSDRRLRDFYQKTGYTSPAEKKTEEIIRNRRAIDAELNSAKGRASRAAGDERLKERYQITGFIESPNEKFLKNLAEGEAIDFDINKSIAEQDLPKVRIKEPTMSVEDAIAYDNAVLTDNRRKVAPIVKRERIDMKVNSMGQHTYDKVSVYDEMNKGTKVLDTEKLDLKPPSFELNDVEFPGGKNSDGKPLFSSKDESIVKQNASDDLKNNFFGRKNTYYGDPKTGAIVARGKAPNYARAVSQEGFKEAADMSKKMSGFKTLGKMAIGGALMYSLVSALSDSGGQQSNAQLYGQQPLY